MFEGAIEKTGITGLMFVNDEDFSSEMIWWEIVNYWLNIKFVKG